MLNEIKQDAQARMGKSIDALRHTLTTIRTGRASPALLDGIRVKAYGSDTPLNQVASIAVSEGRSLVITLFVVFMLLKWAGNSDNTSTDTKAASAQQPPQ